MIQIPKELDKVAGIFADAGYQCWLVGGALRDQFIGRYSDDFDLATDATPQDVQKIFHRTIPTGIKHGTVIILLGSMSFETTTFRSDGDYSDGRHPDHVTYTNDINSDLSRRDFTINAIAYDLINRKLVDPYDGQDDIKHRIIRAIGSPELRFCEDALRMIRACRFAAQLNFSIDSQTLSAIEPLASRIADISKERIWDEFKKIITTDAPSVAFSHFRETGILSSLLPGVDLDDECFRLSLNACDKAPIDNFIVRTAALLHATDSWEILTRYKSPNQVRDKVVWLIDNWQIPFTANLTEVDTRHLLAKIRVENIEDLLCLSQILSPAGKSAFPITAWKNFKKHTHKIINRKDPLSIKDLNINGRIISTQLKLPESRLIGKLLDYLMNCVLNDPQVNTKDHLLELSKDWLNVNHRRKTL